METSLPSLRELDLPVAEGQEREDMQAVAGGGWAGCLTRGGAVGPGRKEGINL